MGETKGKFDGIETLRALACFMVIVLHCAPFSTESATSAETSLLVYIALSRAAVPLFFMITGYLLLDRDEDIFLFYKKRLLRIAAPLLFYSIFYNTVSACLSGEPIRLTAIAAAIVQPYVHLRFLYLLVGV